VFIVDGDIILDLSVFSPFYPLDAMLERVLGTATCLSVCLAVWLSVTAGIVSKRKQLAS